MIALSLFFIFNCSRKRKVPKEIASVIIQNINATNKKYLKKVVHTLCPIAPRYEYTIKVYKKLFSMKRKITFEIQEMRLIEKSETEVTVEVIQRMKVKNPKSRIESEKTRIEHVLVKHNGKWGFFASKIISREHIDKNSLE